MVREFFCTILTTRDFFFGYKLKNPFLAFPHIFYTINVHSNGAAVDKATIESVHKSIKANTTTIVDFISARLKMPIGDRETKQNRISLKNRNWTSLTGFGRTVNEGATAGKSDSSTDPVLLKAKLAELGELVKIMDKHMEDIQQYAKN